MIAHGHGFSDGIGSALFSGFEKVSANLGIDVIAAQGQLRDLAARLFGAKPDSRIVASKKLSTTQPGADLDLR